MICFSNYVHDIRYDAYDGVSFSHRETQNITYISSFSLKVVVSELLLVHHINRSGPSRIYEQENTARGCQSGSWSAGQGSNLRKNRLWLTVDIFRVFFFFLHHFSPMGPINELQRCPSRVWSQGIYPSLPGSRLRVFIAMQVQHSYTSSTNG